MFEIIRENLWKHKLGIFKLRRSEVIPVKTPDILLSHYIYLLPLYQLHMFSQSPQKSSSSFRNSSGKAAELGTT